MPKIQKTEQDWQELLTPEQFEVLRKKGTEPAFSGELLKNKEKGVYQCAACGNQLFSSETKFDSGSGWPSFYDVVNNKNIEVKKDTCHGLDRLEIICAQCGGHLGHVFADGP